MKNNITKKFLFVFIMFVVALTLCSCGEKKVAKRGYDKFIRETNAALGLESDQTYASLIVRCDWVYYKDKDTTVYYKYYTNATTNYFTYFVEEDLVGEVDSSKGYDLALELHNLHNGHTAVGSIK